MAENAYGEPAPEIIIRPAVPEDAEALAILYNQCVDRPETSIFNVPTTPAIMLQYINITHNNGYPVFVAVCGWSVVGHAIATTRTAIIRMPGLAPVEVGILVSQDVRRRRVGTALYDALLHCLRGIGERMVVAILKLPNDEAAAFHYSMGFICAGRASQVLGGRLRFVENWERLL